MLVKIVMAFTARWRYTCTSYRLFLIYNLGKTSVNCFFLRLDSSRSGKKSADCQKITTALVVGGRVTFAFPVFFL